MLGFWAFFHLKLLLHFFKLLFHLKNCLRILAHFRPVKVLKHILIELFLRFIRVILFSLCLLLLRLILLLLLVILLPFVLRVFFLRGLWNSSELLDLCIDFILDLLNIVSCELRLFVIGNAFALVIYLLYLFFLLIDNLMDSLYSLFGYPFFSLNNLLDFLRVLIDLGPDSFIVNFSLWVMLLSVLIGS